MIPHKKKPRRPCPQPGEKDNKAELGGLQILHHNGGIVEPSDVHVQSQGAGNAKVVDPSESLPKQTECRVIRLASHAAIHVRHDQCILLGIVQFLRPAGKDGLETLIRA
jgi:hypothetical protein